MAASVAALMLGTAMSAQACFTVIVGKDASSTGEIIVGHNEDNDRRILMSQYWVPAATHKKGEMIDTNRQPPKFPSSEDIGLLVDADALHLKAIVFPMVSLMKPVY